MPHFRLPCSEACLVVISVVFSILACLVALPVNAQIVNVAHRAGRNVAWPENTIPDIQWSVAVGADWIEIDIWKSADGVLMLHHDPSMCRTTNIGDFPGYDCEIPENNPLGRFPQVPDFDLAFLKTLDVGSWLAPEFAGLQMPTLEEALLEVKGTGVPLVLDIKTLGQASTIAQDLLDVGMTQDDVIAWVRFGAGMANEWKAALPDARLLFGWQTPTAVTEQMIADRAAAGDHGIVVTSPDLTQPFVDLVHSYGLVLMTYPAATGGLDLDIQVNMGVDATVIGDPEWMREYVDALLCLDGVDNDGDTLTDAGEDPGCFSRADRSEAIDCDDGVDNDGDGLIDAGEDAGCLSASDGSEAPDCSDGVDNDGDGLWDWPADVGCFSADDPSERGLAPPLVPSLSDMGLSVLLVSMLGSGAIAARSVRPGRR